MKKKTITVMMLCTLLGVAMPIKQIKAEERLDLKTVSCKDLLLMEGDQRDSTMVFFHGVMIGKKDSTILDAKILSNTTDKVLEHCIDKPQDKLMSVFEKYSN